MCIGLRLKGRLKRSGQDIDERKKSLVQQGIGGEEACNKFKGIVSENSGRK